MKDYRIYGITHTTSANTLLVSMTYKADGRLENIKRSPLGGGLGDLVETTLGYFANGDLQTILHTKGSASPAPAVNQFSYTYDNTHRITSLTSMSEGLSNFGYDAQDQLTSASLTGENYAYDDNGNRTSNGTVTRDHNLVVEDNQNYYVYDAEGNRTKQINKIRFHYHRTWWQH